MYSTVIFLWSSLAVLIFTSTVALPVKLANILNLEPGHTSYTRTLWLHSTNSKGYVRVRGSHVDSLCYNCYRSKDESAKLEMESTVFQGSVVVRLRSVKENSYLCVNLEGNLTVEVHGNTMHRCLFKEDIDPAGFTKFQSMHNTTWFLGFKRSGRVKAPHNTTISQKAARFLKYFS